MSKPYTDTMSPELSAAIDVAKQRVKVDPYFVYGMNKGLKGHAQGFWAGTFMGLLSGAVGGGLLSLGLMLVPGGLAALPVVHGLIGLPLVLGISGLGGVAGGTIGSRIGSSTGSVSGIVGEFERRQKADKLEQEILASPDKQRAAIEAYRKDPVVEKDNTAGEIFATTRSKGKAINKLIDLPTMALTVGLCAAAGVVMFCGAFALAGGAAAIAGGTGVLSVGLGALGINSMAMASIVGASLGALSGITYGITFPAIFTSFTKKTADILAQKAVRGETQFGHIKTVSESLNEGAKLETQAKSQEVSHMTRTAANSNEPLRTVQAITNEGVAAPALRLAKQ